MGNAESAPVPGGGSEGYHVLRVQENSPGQLAGLEPFFDFIVAVGNQRLDKDDENFKQTLSSNVDKPLELTVYNSKTQTVRQTQITPSHSWGGQGILGISIRFCSFEGASQNVWHIISVQPNSPAEAAGLQTDSDYVLGAESVLQQADDLIALVQANVGKPVKLYVYNVNLDTVREVTLTPNDGWGGEGCLGCDIGYGYLHRIPTSVDRSHPPLLAPEPGPEPTIKPAVSSIAQPGFTGLPQVDQIQFSQAQTPVPHFPDPSEFAVQTSTVPAPVETPPVPRPDFPPPSLPPFPSQAPVQSVTSPSVPAYVPDVPPSSTFAPVPPSSTFAPVPPSSTFAPAPTPPVPGLPPPPSSTPAPAQPQQPAPVQAEQTPPPPSAFYQQQQQFLPPAMAGLSLANGAPPQPTETPIHTSSYQPYLAYGAPSQQQVSYQPPAVPPAVPSFQAPPPTVPAFSATPGFSAPPFAPPAQPTYMQSAPPMAPPPLNFPMPPLSSLGISNLAPPAGPLEPAQQFAGQPALQQPHF